MQAPEYNEVTSILPARPASPISVLLDEARWRGDQREEGGLQLDQFFSQELGTILPTIQNLCVSTSENHFPSLILQSETEFIQNPQYDGDFRDPSLRPIGVLLSALQFREEQGEENCQQLDQASIQEVDTTPPAMQDFCVNASEKKPP